MNTIQEAWKKALTDTKALHLQVHCPYCGKPAVMVSGVRIYPHRPDLFEKKFWLCEKCDAYVGCHPRNLNHGQDGTRPLGRLADKELRRLKWKAHSLFDPLWQELGYFPNRKAAYQWLSNQLGIYVNKCHIGFFDKQRCEAVIDHCTSYVEEKKNDLSHS